MAQFDVYRDSAGYLLDVQNDLIGPFNTRIVVPLLHRDVAPLPERRLNPILPVEGKPWVMVTQFLSAVRIRDLDRPVDNLDAHSDRIVAAVDMIVRGF